MSYTPTTWTTGDTITATALNKIENGVANAGSVATVCVNFNDGGISGSMVIYLGYAQYTNNRYSIESPIFEYYLVTPCARVYIPVPLPPTGDNFKAYIFFNYEIDSMAEYTITGNISSTKIEAFPRASASTWFSEIYYGFEVTGDGQIDVSYTD